jgi:hypothetical protein
MERPHHYQRDSIERRGKAACNAAAIEEARQRVVCRKATTRELNTFAPLPARPGVEVAAQRIPGARR